MAPPSVTLCLCLVLGACSVDSVTPLAQRYDALVNAGTAPTAPAFDALLDSLEAVGPNQQGAQKAQRLARAIRASRQTVRTPLARVPKAESLMPVALKAQLGRCAALAAAVGLDGGLTAQAVESLEACRHQADRLDAQMAHEHEP
jgi:ATP phosphoribosyltransferase regulatory subunit HisZ